MAEPQVVDGIAARPIPLRMKESKTRRVAPYICGKIPLAWVKAAIRVGAGDISWALLYFRGLERGRAMSISLKKLGLDCRSEATVRRQLRALADVGLITITGRPGRKLYIEIIGLEQSPADGEVIADDHRDEPPPLTA